MFRKAVLGLVAVMSIILVSTDSASAAYRGRYYGGGYRYGYRAPIAPIYRPRVIYPPVYAQPVYGYPAGGYGGYGGGYGYQPGFGVSTPGFGMYVR